MRQSDILKNVKQSVKEDFNNTLNEYFNGQSKHKILKLKTDNVQNAMVKVDSNYKQKIDYSIDFLNGLFKQYADFLKDSYQSTDPDFMKNNKDIIVPFIQKLNLSQKESDKRKQIHNDAIKISKKIIERELNQETLDIISLKESKFNNNEPNKEEISESTRGAARIIGLGSKYYLQKLLKQPLEDRKNVIFNILNKTKEAAQFMAQDLNDNQFVQYADKYGRFLTATADLEKNSIDGILNELGIKNEDLSVEEKEQLDAWKNKDSKDAVMIAGEYQSRMDMITNPYYLEMSREDMIKVSYAMNKLLNNPDCVNELRSQGYPVEMEDTDLEGNLSPLLHLNNAGTFNFNLLKSDMELNPEQKNNLNEPLKELLTSKFNAINEGAYDNKLNDYKYYDYDKKDYVTKEEMISGFTQGKRFALVDDSSEITMPKIVGEVEANRTNGNIHIDIPAKTKLTAYSDVDFLADIKENLKKANSRTIFTTKEFDNMTDHINKMLKAKTEKEFTKNANEAAKWAKAYLDNKAFSTKTKTPKTYERIRFAEKFYNRFRSQINVKEFENDTFKKLAEKDKPILDQHKNKNFKVFSKELMNMLKELNHTGNLYNLEQEGLQDRAKLIEFYTIYNKVHQLHVQGDPRQFSEKEISNEEKEMKAVLAAFENADINRDTLKHYSNMPIESVVKESINYGKGNYDVDYDYNKDKDLGIDPFIESNEIVIDKIKIEAEIDDEYGKEIIVQEEVKSNNKQTKEVYKGIIENEGVNNNEVKKLHSDIDDLKNKRSLKNQEMAGLYDEIIKINKEDNLLEMDFQYGNGEEHYFDIETDMDKEFELDSRADKDFEQKLEQQQKLKEGGMFEDLDDEASVEGIPEEVEDLKELSSLQSKLKKYFDNKENGNVQKSKSVNENNKVLIGPNKDK